MIITIIGAYDDYYYITTTLLTPKGFSVIFQYPGLCELRKCNNIFAMVYPNIITKLSITPQFNGKVYEENSDSCNQTSIFLIENYFL